MNNPKVDERVLVNEAMAGAVRYVTADGRVGVSLFGEGDRVDEWHPSQVRGGLSYGEWESFALSN